ncbi:uncharacterized protein LOC119078723 [Bradysia coprophila]|uniref:uncharacterized protein LOC119078723 n=1 Tax=Bradysia coprophila TaxID=38358 RepID=UPI00187DB0E0|nr:uncharacterized protein LOC119078723 [Bradysia coprophila]
MNPDLQMANDLYNKSQEPHGISRPLRRSYLEKSLSLYRSQMRHTAQKNVPSLQKNYGLASYRLADVLDADDDLPLIIFHLSEAIQAFSTAWVMRPKDKQTEWGSRLEELISDCFEKSHRSLNGDVTKFHFIDQLSKAVGNGKENDVHRIRLHLANGQYFYRCGVKVMEGNDYLSTVRMVEYASHQFELAAQSAHGSTDNFSIDISRLQEDISFLRKSCEAIKLREQADRLFDDQVMQSEEFNFEMVWTILDLYKASEMHCRNVDIENEAIALSRQGRLFHKIFNLRSKAHTYYRASFDLAVSLHPKDMNNFEWFKECKTALEEHQKATVREEEAKKDKERAPYLEKMKDKLDALKSHATDAFKLLKYIYTNHPPKVSYDYKENSIDSTNIKKALLNAIIQYHPDKQVQYDMEWRVLSEEITKCLNVRYECFKGC